VQVVGSWLVAVQGWERVFWEGGFGTELNLAGWAQKLSGKPAITVGSVTLKRDVIDSRGGSGSEAADNLPLLFEMMARGDFDFVAVGRALIANPSWPQNVRDGQPIQPFLESALAQLS
ncbi:hypothetical protein B5V02_08855, partial [Mesorhizobium kowhaii]